MLSAQVRGDVFLARVFDNEDNFERLDFSLADVSSSAGWVKEAHAQNRRKQNVSTIDSNDPDTPAVISSECNLTYMTSYFGCFWLHVKGPNDSLHLKPLLMHRLSLQQPNWSESRG